MNSPLFDDYRVLVCDTLDYVPGIPIRLPSGSYLQLIGWTVSDNLLRRLS